MYTLILYCRLREHFVTLILFFALLANLDRVSVSAQEFPGEYGLKASKTKIKHDEAITLTLTITPAYDMEKTYYIMCDTTYMDVLNGYKRSNKINAGQKKEFVFKVRPKKTQLQRKIPIRVFFNWARFSQSGWSRGVLLEIIDIDNLKEDYSQQQKEISLSIYVIPDTARLIIPRKSKTDTLRISLPAIMENDTLRLYFSSFLLGDSIKYITIEKVDGDSLVIKRSLELKTISIKKDTVKPVGVPVYRK